MEGGEKYKNSGVGERSALYQRDAVEKKKLYLSCTIYYSYNNGPDWILKDLFIHSYGSFTAADLV